MKINSVHWLWAVDKLVKMKEIVNQQILSISYGISPTYGQLLSN